jgi:hypothetical protein
MNTVNPAAGRADTSQVPYQSETSYFVRLDAPPPSSRQTPLQRERWDEPAAPVGGPPGRWKEPKQRKRRPKRRIEIRPVTVVVLLVAGWLAWAYTTPGGPSARVRGWIDHTRTDVADVSLGPGLHKTANYFNGLYATQGSYPQLSETQLQEDPNTAFGINMGYQWCSPGAVVLSSNGAGGSVSRLLLAGKDLGNVNGVHGCPENLRKPRPWKIPKAAT